MQGGAGGQLNHTQQEVPPLKQEELEMLEGTSSTVSVVQAVTRTWCQDRGLGVPAHSEEIRSLYPGRPSRGDGGQESTAASRDIQVGVQQQTGQGG